MIGGEEIDEWASRFEVPQSQIERDHLVSHLLVALRELLPQEVVFFGGTALCRTHLPNMRLSEDIDLLVENPRVFAELAAESLPRGVRREFPHLTVGPITPSGRSLTTRLEAPRVEGIQLQYVQIEPDERQLIFEERPVLLRYSDLPSDVLWRVPNEESFVVMKVKAWRDRFAPRDLFDLWKLAEAGFMTKQVHHLLRRTTGVGFIIGDFDGPREVAAAAWMTELSNQVARLPAFEEALAAVRASVEEVLSA